MSEKEITYKVLLIEDTEKDRTRFEQMLNEDEEFNYQITSADRLATGLRFLSADTFNLVLLDLFLPETKGLRTLKKVFERKPHIAVVVLTQLDDESAGLDAVRNGAQEYLVKGHFDGYSLRRAIRHAIERSQIETALRKSEQKHKQLIAELKQTNKELEEFSYSVSHDLRAPLRAITGFSEILEKRFRSELPDGAHHYLDNIVQAGKQMGELIDDLLDYSRLGKGSMSYGTLNLNDFFAALSGSIKTRLKSTGTNLIIPENLPTIVANTSLLQQIFLNLINNAMTFVEEGKTPQIEITCQEEGESVLVGVKDNGIGIADDQQQRIFNVFQRLHSQEEYPGTGIGLSIVQKAVEIFRGDVQVESALGKGTTFLIRIPKVQGK